MKKKLAAKWIIWLLVICLMVTLTACRRTTEENSLGEENPDVSDEAAPEPEKAVDSTESSPADLQYYVLYLKHRDQAFIFSNTYSVRENDPVLADRTLNEYVLERLFQQKAVGELINPIHPETQVLSLEQDGRNLTVNLSKHFVEGMKGSKDDTEAVIAMVVNTLITLPGTDRVHLLIEGKKPDQINGLAIKDVYEFMTDFYPDK